MHIYTDIVMGAWATFIIWWGISAFNVKRDVSGTAWWVRNFGARMAILALILLVLAYFGRLDRVEFIFGQFLGVSPTGGALAAIGAALAVLGIALAIYARVHLGRNWSPAPALKEGHQLITSGPYRLIRHPIYTGILIAALGSAFVAPFWGIVFVGGTIAFTLRVRAEEKLMLSQFPNEYPAYQARTWALIPYLY